MKKEISILILTLIGNVLIGQPLTKEKAFEFADKLSEVEILSEKGSKLLKNYITESKLKRSKRQNLKDGSISMTNDLSVSQILLFCSQAFGSEFYYRSGLLTRVEIREQLKNEKGLKETNEEDYDKLRQEVEERMKNFEGYKIEEEIKNEEVFSDSPMSRVIYPFSISTVLSDTDEYGLIHRNRSASGKTLTRTLNDLLKIHLIDSTNYREVFNKLKVYRLNQESDLLLVIAEKVIFNEDFEENKKNEIEFLTHLKRKKIISDKNFKTLLNSYGQKELKTKYDYIQYCNHAKIFDLSLYSKIPELGYKQIFEEIKSIVPGFDFKNFKIEISKNIEEWDTGLTELKATISFMAGEIQYSNSFFYDFVKREPAKNEKSDTLLKIRNDFHKGVNKFLADKNSPYRLYYVNKFKQGNAYGEQEFGLILLTEEQFKAWGTSNSEYFLFNQSHDNTFNIANIQTIIEQYEKIGLFKHLTNEEIETAKKCIKESEISSYQDILLCFPKTIVYFDWESDNLENPYKELTKAFGEASRDAFNPVNIKDRFKENWESETTYFSFEFNDKKYETYLKMESDWLDSGFMELIEKALVENNIDGKIYYCLENGQEAGYIFLTKKQYEYLKKNQPKLFPKF